MNNVRRPADFETAVKDKEAAKENIKVCDEIKYLSFQKRSRIIDCRKWATKIINTSSYWVSKSIKTGSNHQRTCWHWQQHYFKSVSSLRSDIH